MLHRRGVHFEHFVEATRGTCSREHLICMFARWMEDLGMDLMNFSVKFDPRLPEEAHQFGIYSNYSKMWRDYYDQQGYVDIDPVLKAARGNADPFRWRDLNRRMKLTKPQIAFLRESDAAGLRHGIGIPFKGPNGQVGGIALASSLPRLDVTISLDLLSAYANLFYDRYRLMILRGRQTPVASVTLTDMEFEVMVRIAHGRTDRQIATALGKSIHTINTHNRHMFEKLETSNRAAAVQKARDLGLI